MEDKKSLNNIGTIGHVDHGKTTLTAAHIKSLVNGNDKVVIIGAGKETDIPDDIKDKVRFVNDVSELSEEEQKIIKDKTQDEIDPTDDLRSKILTSEPYIFEGTYSIPYAFDDGIRIKKYRGQSNKKYVKRKKAKNGKAKNKRKK